MVPMTREMLDRERCSTPGCTGHHDGIYLRSGCHPDVPTCVRYKDGVLEIECAHCHRPIAAIRVGSALDLAGTPLVQ